MNWRDTESFCVTSFIHWLEFYNKIRLFRFIRYENSHQDPCTIRGGRVTIDNDRVTGLRSANGFSCVTWRPSRPEARKLLIRRHGTCLRRRRSMVVTQPHTRLFSRNTFVRSHRRPVSTYVRLRYGSVHTHFLPFTSGGRRTGWKIFSFPWGKWTDQGPDLTPHSCSLRPTSARSSTLSLSGVLHCRSHTLVGLQVVTSNQFIYHHLIYSVSTVVLPPSRHPRLSLPRGSI